MTEVSSATRLPWVPIPTRLHPPRPPAGAVERPRLLAQLDEAALISRVALLSAPAGYGKTILAAQWLARSAAVTAWLSIDAADNDFESFCRYLVAAVERTRPGSLPQSAALLTAHSTPPANYVSQVLRAELARASEPLVIAIDDYHSITASAVHELVRSLVEDLPESVRLMLLSRSDPALPLARWRGRGWLVELRARDLRFSHEESAAYFAATAGPRLDSVDLKPLFEGLEGWPAGLQLARLSIARAADPAEAARRFTGSDRLIVDYLMDEVLSTLPPAILRFLAATAPFPRFNAELCERLLPRGASERSAAELLAEVRQRGLFLVALDPEERWFRYHHLFAQLLDHHLPERASRQSRREIASLAAEWFAEQNLVEEALRLWVDAGEIDAAANLLGRHLDGLLDQHDALHLLRHLLAIFPTGAERGRPALLVAHCHEKIVRWDLPGIGAMLDEAESCLETSAPAGTPDLPADIDTLRSFLAYWQGEAEQAIRYGDRALASSGVAPRGWIRSLASIYRAGGLFLAGRVAEAHQFLEQQALDDDVRDGPHFGRYLLIPGFLRLYACDLEAAQVAARRVIASSKTVPISGYWLGEAEYLIGSVALERDRLEEAETWFRRVLERRYSVESPFLHDSLIGLALVAERRGDLAKRDEWTVAARAWALEAGDAGSLLRSDSFESRGRRDGPEALPRDSILSQLVNTLSVWLEVPNITACERLLFDPDPQVRRTALPTIDALMTRFEARHNDRQALRLAVLRADALADASRRDEALKLLAKLLRRAEPQGIVRPFLGGGPPRLELLATLGSRGPYRSFVERVLSSSRAAGDAESPAAAPAAVPGPAIEPLTAREQEVLELLAERLANKEIAAQLGVSSETVKKRLLGIYGKLGVHGRREAVAAALARGLIGRSH